MHALTHIYIYTTSRDLRQLTNKNSYSFLTKEEFEHTFPFMVTELLINKTKFRMLNGYIGIGNTCRGFYQKAFYLQIQLSNHKELWPNLATCTADSDIWTARVCPLVCALLVNLSHGRDTGQIKEQFPHNAKENGTYSLPGLPCKIPPPHICFIFSSRWTPKPQPNPTGRTTALEMRHLRAKVVWNRNG